MHMHLLSTQSHPGKQVEDISNAAKTNCLFRILAEQCTTDAHTQLCTPAKNRKKARKTDRKKEALSKEGMVKAPGRGVAGLAGLQGG